MDKWNEYALGDIITYEQPTHYIVESTDYNNEFKTPVLTAGKSFIIGYTNETIGIYDKLPVIIFDDFTTSTQYVNFPFKVKSSAMKILRANDDLVIPKFIFYRMQTIEFDHSTHKRYWIQQYSKIKVRIPPISEQKRIIAYIEEMFSQLEKGVETLRTVKQQIAVYRQAVLKEAFERLTDYEVKSISEVCSDIVDCPHSTPQWTSQGQLCLRTTNFRRGYLDLSERNFVSTETFNLRNIRLKPKSGDVLYSREGAILGIACIIPENVSVCLGQRMMLLRVKKLILNKFLMHYLNSPYVTMHVASVTGGSASPHINVGDIKKFKIPVPSITEQLKLIRTVDGRLSVCDSLEQTIDTTLQQTKALRQIILKNVFEGD